MFDSRMAIRKCKIHFQVFCIQPYSISIVSMQKGLSLWICCGGKVSPPLQSEQKCEVQVRASALLCVVLTLMMAWCTFAVTSCPLFYVSLHGVCFLFVSPIFVIYIFCLLKLFVFYPKTGCKTNVPLGTIKFNFIVELDSGLHYWEHIALWFFYCIVSLCCFSASAVFYFSSSTMPFVSLVTLWTEML